MDMAKKKKRDKRTSPASQGTIHRKKQANDVSESHEHALAKLAASEPVAWASTKVLMLPELLELSLAELPVADLLFVQRVCQRWKTAIEQSRKLQQGLFFTPAEEPFRYLDFPPIIYRLRGRMIQVATGRASLAQRPIENPMLPYIFSQMHMHKNVTSNGRMYRAFNYRHASWRKLLVTQPTAVEMCLWRHHYRIGLSGSMHYAFTTSDKQGPSSNNCSKFYEVEGLKLAALTPEYAFGLNGNQLSDLTITIHIENSNTWNGQYLRDLTATQLKIQLSGHTEHWYDKQRDRAAHPYDLIAAWAGLAGIP